MFLSFKNRHVEDDIFSQHQSFLLAALNQRIRFALPAKTYLEYLLCYFLFEDRFCQQIPITNHKAVSDDLAEYRQDVLY